MRRDREAELLVAGDGAGVVPAHVQRDDPQRAPAATLAERQADGFGADPLVKQGRVLQVDAEDGLLGSLTRLEPDRADVGA